MVFQQSKTFSLKCGVESSGDHQEKNQVGLSPSKNLWPHYYFPVAYDEVVIKGQRVLMISVVQATKYLLF